MDVDDARARKIGSAGTSAPARITNTDGGIYITVTLARICHPGATG